MITAKAYINLSALINNLRIIKKQSSESKIIAVVKANAYGHGVLNVAATIEDYVECFAVARLEEALFLRKNNISKPILILGGLFNEEDLIQIANNDFQIVLHSFELLKKIENLNIVSPLKCWLKLDTGMHRLGVLPEEVNLFYDRIKKCRNIDKHLGLISHLCVADDCQYDAFTLNQISIFNNFKDKYPELSTALANSAAIFSYPSSHTEWVRPGITLYGVSPYTDKRAEELGLKPVMTFKSKIIAIRKLSKGDKLGYGLAFESKTETYIGIIGVGYGDGYPRQAPNGTPILINGRLVPSVGHVCMDMMFVDLGIDSQDKIGDEVTLWGKGLPIEVISQKVGTIPYELLLRLTNRVEMIYIAED